MTKLKLEAGATALTLMFAGAAFAEDFHGFDPANFDGAMLSAEQLQAMVKDAAAVTPPRNGSKYVIAFANLQRDMTFGVVVEKGIRPMPMPPVST
jgi:ribose transport system substrate-binding protein